MTNTNTRISKAALEYACIPPGHMKRYGINYHIITGAELNRVYTQRYDATIKRLEHPKKELPKPLPESAEPAAQETKRKKGRPITVNYKADPAAYQREWRRNNPNKIEMYSRKFRTKSYVSTNKKRRDAIAESRQEEQDKLCTPALGHMNNAEMYAYRNKAMKDIQDIVTGLSLTNMQKAVIINCLGILPTHALVRFLDGESEDPNDHIILDGAYLPSGDICPAYNISRHQLVACIKNEAFKNVRHIRIGPKTLYHIEDFDKAFKTANIYGTRKQNPLD